MEETLATFPISDENVEAFTREVERPMDCVINAYQLLGFIDDYTAELMRMTCPGDQGLSLVQLERTMAYMSHRRLSTVLAFKPSSSFDEFQYYLSSNLGRGLSAFCGITRDDGSSHVFVVAINSVGQFVLLDPQLDETMCDLAHSDCLSNITDNVNTWYCLTLTNIPMNIDIMNFIFTEDRPVAELLPEIEAQVFA